MGYDIKCDVHTHTLFSGHAYSTLAENVQYAAKAGMELIASTDHFGSMICPNGDLREVQHLINTDMWPREWDGVYVMRGMEADIVDLEGHLFGQDILSEYIINGDRYKESKSLYDRLVQWQDYVIASIHVKEFTEGASLSATTDMYCKAMEAPKVMIVGHPGRPGVPFDIDTVLLEAKKKKVLVELNALSLGRDTGGCRSRCREIAIRCAELDVPVALSTDAHICTAMGDFSRMVEFLEEIDFPKHLNMCSSKEVFLQHFDFWKAVNSCV